MSLFGKAIEKIKGVITPSGPTTCMEKCPRSLVCPQWVILEQHYKVPNKPDIIKTEGRCAMAWIPQLLGEVRDAILNKKGD